MARTNGSVALNEEAKARLADQQSLQNLHDYDGMTVDDLIRIGSQAASEAIVKAYRDNLSRRGK
jgi:hypothetical protein